MKLTQIDIERFGIWQNLSLPVFPRGITVLQGPNEAGKTTLLRFIRGMLYGVSSTETLSLRGRQQGLVSPYPWSGSITVEHQGGSYQIRRSANSDAHAMLSVLGPNGKNINDQGQHPPDAGQLILHDDRAAEERMLDRMRHGISAELFEHLYAIELIELQELATWDDEKVAEHLYGLTLGPAGSSLLHAHREADAMRERLTRSNQHDASPGSREGEIDRLWKRYCDVSRRIEGQETKIHRYREVLSESDDLNDQIAEIKSRRAGLEEQLRGHQFMERVWGPWQRLENLRDEWKQTPKVKGFPENGMQTLLELEREQDSAMRCRDSVRAEIDRCRAELKSCQVHRRLLGASASIRHLRAMRGKIESISSALSERRQDIAAHKERLHAQLRDLNATWDIDRLDESSDLAEHADSLHRAASEYRLASMKRNRLARRMQKQLKGLRRERMLWKERLPLSVHLTPTEGLKQAIRRRRYADELCRVDLSIEALEKQQQWTIRQISQGSRASELPGWGWWAVAGFTTAGIMLFIGGLLTGWWHSALAGTIVFLLAIASASIGWAIKSHFSATENEDQEKLLAEHLEIKEELETLLARKQFLCDALDVPTLQAVDAKELTENPPVSTQADALYRIKAEQAAASAMDEDDSSTADDESHEMSDDSDENFENLADEQTDAGSIESATSIESSDIDPWELVRREDAAIQDWKEFSAWHTRWLQSRKSLGDDRARFQDRQRQLATKRKIWCQALSEIFLPETLNIEEGLADYQRLLSASRTVQNWKQLDRQVRRDERTLSSFLNQVQRLQRRIDVETKQSEGESSVVPPRPASRGESISVLTVQESLHLLNRWADELKRMHEQRRERRRLIKEIRLRRREEREYAKLTRDYENQAAALLVKGGAATREEFEQRAAWAQRRSELRSLITEAKERLADAARTEPELAVVESDLRQFDPEQNAECIHTVRRELDDLNDDLHIAYEELGQLKQEIKTLTSDRASAALRREREEVVTQLRRACIDWCALDWTRQGLDRLRDRHEMNSQPETLKFASEYLQRLTDGKYRRIWAPLGEHRLCVDDSQDRRWMIEQLSGGTREQVFLAVRLALISKLAEQGIELPIVLDDVLVNFDERRMQAAVSLLSDYTTSGGQILVLTCHSHIAEAFERIGISPRQLQRSEHAHWERQAG